MVDGITFTDKDGNTFSIDEFIEKEETTQKEKELKTFYTSDQISKVKCLPSRGGKPKLAYSKDKVIRTEVFNMSLQKQIYDTFGESMGQWFSVADLVTLLNAKKPSISSIVSNMYNHFGPTGQLLRKKGIGSNPKVNYYSKQVGKSWTEEDYKNFVQALNLISSESAKERRKRKAAEKILKPKVKEPIVEKEPIIDEPELIVDEPIKSIKPEEPPINEKLINVDKIENLIKTIISESLQTKETTLHIKVDIRFGLMK